MATVRTGPTLGLIVQFLVLMALDATVQLSNAGWLAAVAFGVAVWAALNSGMGRWGTATFGPADWVTSARAALVGGVAALTVDSFTGPAPVGLLAGLAIMALALDAVDGQVARRTGTVTAFGARFDMEVDAALLLVLSLYVARPFGAWVLLIGGMRYLFVAATWVVPWMRATLPPRYWCKVVAVVQGVVLVTAASGLFPRPVIMTALAAALALLIESFGREVLWLWRLRSTASEVRVPGVRMRA